jgi:hypothetical protein
MKWDIMGRILRCTLSCDMLIPASESRSMSERSNLYSFLPGALSIDKASEKVELEE